MSGGLTNHYVSQLAFKLIGKKLFVGVFAANECFQVPTKKKFCLIFNEDNLHQPGSHFVSIFVSEHEVHYFDSFGDTNVQKNISHFISTLNRKCFMHCNAIQDNSSSFCGLFALAFLLWMKDKGSCVSFYKMFNKNNLKKNNFVVTKYILNKIK